MTGGEELKNDGGEKMTGESDLGLDTFDSVIGRAKAACSLIRDKVNLLASRAKVS